MKPPTVNAAALAALLGASAVNHLRNPRFYYPVVPPALCTDKPAIDKPGTDKGSTDKPGALALMTRHQWVLISAAPEMLAAVGLLIPRTRQAAATATMVMFVAFTAGHLTALQRACGPKGTPSARRIHALRLPLQVPLIVWAWSARRT